MQSEKQEGVPLSFSLSLLVPLLINLIFPLSSFSQTEEETLTITTYYPAPYGVYNEMRAKRMAVGANYYNGSAFPWNTGGVCMGNEICKNTDLVVQGRVGIGTTRPANKLDVEGAMAVGATYSGTSAGPTNGMIIEGNVGIGTANPQERLDVAGGVRVGNVAFPLSLPCVNGTIKYNPADNSFAGCSNGVWYGMGGAAGLSNMRYCIYCYGDGLGGPLEIEKCANFGSWTDWAEMIKGGGDLDYAACKIKIEFVP